MSHFFQCYIFVADSSPAMMRKTLQPSLRAQTSGTIIVVEDDEKEDKYDSSSQKSSEDETHNMNPFFLSPFAREIRKHSLPTPQCSGITASQVRRLSERGETAGPGPKQAEFLATLSTTAQPTASGRRHSVVTISRLPPAFFGSGRRESVAAFPSPGRILPSRRESIACPPTSTESRGSVHNLQLDIMDDIVQARKVRMQIWNDSTEKLCEIQALDETPAGSSIQKYSNNSRRFSDFIGTTLTPIPSRTKRRASELPPTAKESGSNRRPPTNADVMAILSSLSTSAMEIHKYDTEHSSTKDSSKVPKGKQRMKGHRSNSFDMSVLDVDEQHDKTITRPSTWFAKRHQPLKPREIKPKKPTHYQSLKEKLKETKKVIASVPTKVLWDERAGLSSDSNTFGSAIENFIRKNTSGKMGSSSTSPKSSKDRSKSWFSKGDDDSSECESSICSTLKDLFVK